MDSREEVVGLIPAGGQAIRVKPLPCSKELFPIGFHRGAGGHGSRPKVVAHYLLEKMRSAGISKSYIVLRPGKWDIPAYFGDGSQLDMQLAYLMLGAPFGVPFTLDQAYPFVRYATVAFGFPDILFGPDDAFAKLLARQSETQPDVVLGLCPSRHPSKDDAVDFDDNGIVKDILRPGNTLRYSWAIAVWKPAFSEFLHGYVCERKAAAPEAPELTAGHAIGASVKAGLRVESVILGEEPYLDIGTPEDLAEATRRAIEGLI
jgi:glucose-1-phosphate thymidylyltransferase